MRRWWRRRKAVWSYAAGVANELRDAGFRLHPTEVCFSCKHRGATFRRLEDYPRPEEHYCVRCTWGALDEPTRAALSFVDETVPVRKPTNDEYNRLLLAGPFAEREAHEEVGRGAPTPPGQPAERAVSRSADESGPLPEGSAQ